PNCLLTMKLFVYTSLDEALQSYLREKLPATVQLFFRDGMSDSQSADAFGSAEIIMGNPPVDWFKRIPPKLTFWQLDSAGFEKYRHLSIQIPVANMGDFFARPCAETIVAGALAFYRGLPLLMRSQDKKKWLGGEVRPSL